MSDDSEKEKLELLRGLTDQAFDDIKAEMKRLKLDRGKAAYRRPLDLLEEAYLAIRYPASAQGTASSALLTLRGSIDCSIEELSGHARCGKKRGTVATESCRSASTAARAVWRWRTSIPSPRMTKS